MKKKFLISIFIAILLISGTVIANSVISLNDAQVPTSEIDNKVLIEKLKASEEKVMSLQSEINALKKENMILNQKLQENYQALSYLEDTVNFSTIEKINLHKKIKFLEEQLDK